MAITLTKEDGNGLANANSYEDDAGATAYMENTGRKDAFKAFDTSARLGALISATAYMDDTYRDRFKGDLVEATQDTQALAWPRENLTLPSGAVRDPTSIPAEISEACAEFAFAMLSAGVTDLQPNAVYDATGRTVDEQTVRVEGAVLKSVKYTGGTGSPKRRKYPAAERILRRWLCPSGGNLVTRL